MLGVVRGGRDDGSGGRPRFRPADGLARPLSACRRDQATAGGVSSPVVGSKPYFFSIRIQRGALRWTISAS